MIRIISQRLRPDTCQRGEISGATLLKQFPGSDMQTSTYAYESWIINF